MNRTLRASLITSSVLAFALLGCNSLLDDQPGVMTEADEAGITPGPGPTPTGTNEPQTPPPDSGTPTTDSGTKPSAECPAGQQMCFGTCVSNNDPLYGCGAACTVCPVPKTASAATCTNDACGVTACGAGLANCDGAAANGCEVTLASDNANCGACGNACVAPQTCVAGACAAP
jgi:hypothetical protein